MHIFNFSSVVSSDYVYKFLAMQDSLSKYCSDYHMYALCVDPLSFKVLKKMPLKNTTVIPVAELEKGRLYQAKNNRNHHEYCWTLKPFFLRYIMKKSRDAFYYAHLDADLFFYSDPVEIVNEDLSASAFLTDHNFSDEFLSSYESSGKYNTGFVCCKRDAVGYAAASWWLEKCYEECSLIAYPEREIYGDQRYVEKWPELFPSIHIVGSKGANVAQWNVGGFDIREQDGDVLVENDKLIFYHFSGFNILGDDEYSLCTFYPIAENPLKLIYMPYIRSISGYISQVAEEFPDFREGISERIFIPNVHRVKISNNTFEPPECLSLPGLEESLNAGI